MSDRVANTIRKSDLDVEFDEKWLNDHWGDFLKFCYSEYPAWDKMAMTTPKTYESVARENALPVFRVGVVTVSKLFPPKRVSKKRGDEHEYMQNPLSPKKRIRKDTKWRILYVVSAEDPETVWPLYVVGKDKFGVVFETI